MIYGCDQAKLLRWEYKIGPAKASTQKLSKETCKEHYLAFMSSFYCYYTYKVLKIECLMAAPSNCKKLRIDLLNVK